MSANVPNIPVGLDLDIEPLFQKITEFEARLEKLSAKFSGVIVNALGTDPEFARQLRPRSNPPTQLSPSS
jgi:hypothetical protein